MVRIYASIDYNHKQMNTGKVGAVRQTIINAGFIQTVIWVVFILHVPGLMMMDVPSI